MSVLALYQIRFRLPATQFASLPVACISLPACIHSLYALQFLHVEFLETPPFFLIDSLPNGAASLFWLPSFSFLFIVGFGYLSLKSMIIVAVLEKLITVGFNWQSACIWSCVESILRHRWVFQINIFVCRVCLDGLLYWRFINPKSSAWRHSCVSFLSSFKLVESLNSLLQVCVWNLYWRLLYIFASLCYSVEYCERGAWLLLYYVHEAWSLKHDGVDKKLLIEAALSTAWRMPEDWAGCVEDIEDCCVERMMEHWGLHGELESLRIVELRAILNLYATYCWCCKTDTHSALEIEWRLLHEDWDCNYVGDWMKTAAWRPRL